MANVFLKYFDKKEKGFSQNSLKTRSIVKSL